MTSGCFVTADRCNCERLFRLMWESEEGKWAEVALRKAVGTETKGTRGFWLCWPSAGPYLARSEHLLEGGSGLPSLEGQQNWWWLRLLAGWWELKVEAEERWVIVEQLEDECSLTPLRETEKDTERDGRTSGEQIKGQRWTEKEADKQTIAETYKQAKAVHTIQKKLDRCCNEMLKVKC